MSSETTVVVRNGQLPEHPEPVDVVITDGEIAAVHRAGELGETTATQVIDADGGLLSPGFVDGHMHLDMAHASESCPLDWNEYALDADRFHSLMNEYYVEQTVEGLADAAERAIRAAVANGTTHIRTHAMVDLDPGVDTLRALLRAREATAHLADVHDCTVRLARDSR